MPETYNDDLWREVEQEDSCSSIDSYLYLKSSNDTEIITVPVEHVPHVQSEVERFMRALRQVIAGTYREIQDGGAHAGSDTDTAPDTDTATVQYADDTVDIVSPADTDKDQDINITQTQDSQDTQALH